MLLETLCLVLTVLALGLTGAIFWLVRQVRSQWDEYIERASRESARTNELLGHLSKQQVEQSRREQEDRGRRAQFDTEVGSSLNGLAVSHNRVGEMIGENALTLQAIEVGVRQQTTDRKNAEVTILTSIDVLRMARASGQAKADTHAQAVAEGITRWQKYTSAEIAALTAAVTDVAADVKKWREENVTVQGRTDDGFGNLMLNLGRLEDMVRSLIQVVPSHESPPERWLLGDRDRPTILVNRIDFAPGMTRWNKENSPPSGFKIPDAVNTRLTEIVRSLPGITSATSNLHTLRVVYSPETAAGFQTGGLEQVQALDGRWLPLARDVQTRQMVEIGHLVSQINPVAVLNTGWQIATMLTAQKHLARIHDQLARLDRRLSRLSDLMSSETIGTLIGDYKYLNQLGDILSNGFASRADLLAYTIKIEDIEQDSIRIFEASRQRIERTISVINGAGSKTPTGQKDSGLLRSIWQQVVEKNQQLDGIRRRNVELEPFGAILEAFEEDAHLMVNSLHVRLLALQTKRLMPAHEGIVTIRLEDVAEMHQAIGSLSREFLSVAERIAPEESFWTRWVPRLFVSRKRRKLEGMKNYQGSVTRAIRQSLKDLNTSRISLTEAFSSPQESLVLDCVYDSDTQRLTELAFVPPVPPTRNLRRAAKRQHFFHRWSNLKKPFGYESRLHHSVKCRLSRRRRLTINMSSTDETNVLTITQLSKLMTHRGKPVVKTKWQAPLLGRGVTHRRHRRKPAVKTEWQGRQ